MQLRAIRIFGLGLSAGLLANWAAEQVSDLRFDFERWKRHLAANPAPAFQGHSEVDFAFANWQCNCHGPHYVSVWFEDHDYGDLTLEDYSEVRMNDWTDLSGLYKRCILAIQVLFGKRCLSASVGLDPDTAREIATALNYGAERLEAFYVREGYDWRSRRLNPLKVPATPSPEMDRSMEPTLRD